MAITINGTTGVAGVDASASTPAFQGSDSNTGVSFASDTVNINTGGSTRATVDSSGRVLIGTTSASPANSYADNLVVSESSGDGGISIFGNNSNSNYASLYFGDAGAANRGYLEMQLGANGNFTIGGNGSGPVRFVNNGAERMRVTQNANNSTALYINQTSEVSGANSHLVVNNAIACVTGSDYRSMYMSGNGQIYWWNGTNQPYISTGGVFTDASDVSLKKDITDLTYGIDVLKNLKPRKYKMKADDKEQIGFIAQEVESEIPEVVDTSETPNGDAHKGLAYGHLTAVLTKALQEAVAKIEVLETKVALLEAA